MTTAPRAPATKEDDQQKSQTPDKLRNDDARWKDKDMPEAEHGATPEDYERPGRCEVWSGGALETATSLPAR